MRTSARFFLCTVLVAGVLSTRAVAQPSSSAESLRDIKWIAGPATADLESIARIVVPDGFRFADAVGAKRFMELTHNIPGRELGVILPPDGNWFVTFDFNPIGYVKDDEKDTIDADQLMANIKRATERGNEERKRRGWETMTVTGWQQAPRYDMQTNHLTWAIRGKAEAGDEVINHSVRLLGRGGVMQADLVLSLEHIATTLPQLNQLLTGFSFKPGQRYAEFRSGDKVAAYGLTALVAGGAGAAAAKSGLLAKLWKAIVLGFIAVVGAIRRTVGNLFGKNRDSQNSEQQTTPA
jgi:uncharacterized membrane-anchored protein